MTPETLSVPLIPGNDPSLIRDELLHELFEAAADRRPDHPALVCGDQRLTYRALDEEANRLAHLLLTLGVQRGERVAIGLPRSTPMYIAMLAVLKTGAAYVPLDSEIPVDRARFILEDSEARCLISGSRLADGLGTLLPILNLERDDSKLAGQSSTRLPRTQTNVTPEDVCYLIYTSGTTGRPKGVQIEHRNVTNLIRAESKLYGIRSDDTVFQLASLAFDASIEEIWMAFFHGATLVAGTYEIIHSGSEFPVTLTRLNVTVLSCVPTFLSMIDADIPTVRILILGGETCPQELVQRWLKPGRQLFNTYGPSEATVIATAALIAPHDTVTIGAPIANVQIYILDPAGKPLLAGESGELCIAGSGVARGYLNRPELQREKFITTDAVTGQPLRLYRSGDLARLRPDGQIDYLGRLDDQVKLRGFRIELSEIEAVLRECPGVLAAAATVHAPTQQIAAYIVPKADLPPDRMVMRLTLSSKLQSYMVPAFLDELPALPMTSSGKIDRRRLPEPILPLRELRKNAVVAPRTDTERTVINIWKEVLKRDAISIHDDFFQHLDGHSLLAAVSISKLRHHPGFERLSVGDLYAHPTAEALAGLAQKASPKNEPRTPFSNTSRAKYLFCGLGQAVGILFLAGVYAWQWLGAFLTYGYLAVADWSLPHSLFAALIVYLIMTPAILLLSIVAKWTLLGKIKPGHYPLWGWFYWRFWFVRTLVRSAPVPYLSGTPFLNWYYRLMGAKIGRDVFIGSVGLATFDALTVGDGSSIGTDTTLDGTSVENGVLKIFRVTIGNGCWVGNRCSLGSNAVIEDGAGLDDLSMLSDGARVPAGELWRGSPAEPAGRLRMETPRCPWSPKSIIAQLIGIFSFPLVTLAGIFPGLIVIVDIGHKDPGYFFLFGAPLVAISFVLFLCLEVWAFKWLLLGRIREGVYRVGGSFHVRLWFFDQLMDLCLEVIGTFYTTLYLAPWLKSLGAHIGKRSEISTIRLIHPDLLTTGPECFLADDVMVGTPRVRNGWIMIGRAHLGERVFVGNGAILPAEVHLGDNVLIGALSLAPAHHTDALIARSDQPARAAPFPERSHEAVPDGTSWFGSPPIFLPARKVQDQFSDARTYSPTRGLIMLRLFIEFFRIILPSTLFVVLASLIVNVTDIMQDHVGLGTWLMSLPALYVIAGVFSVLFTWLMKVVFIGRYREDQKPLWSPFVWRSELLTGVYENLCVLFFLNLLRGTPFIAWVLRALGMRVGRQCYIDTTWFTEFDLITVGDEAALNEDANIQTHLFEDRVMKMGSISLGRRCTVGSMSTVLYSTQVGNSASLGELSLLMKGEDLSDGTRWSGIPARRLSDTTSA